MHMALSMSQPFQHTSEIAYPFFVSWLGEFAVHFEINCFMDLILFFEINMIDSLCRRCACVFQELNQICCFLFESLVSSVTVILSLLSYCTSQCIQPEGTDDICFMFVLVTGWTEHLQFVLHTAHRVLKVVQPEREVQQWQKPWLYKPKFADGWPRPGCHASWARGRWVDPSAVDSWGRRGATQRPRTGTRSCTRKISSTR